MTQTCELTTRPIPARRRTKAALPVLISIPNLAVEGHRAPKTRGRRRRLRREVRVVGYALLVILPLSMAFATLGGDKLPPLPARLVIEWDAATVESSPDRAPVISLAPLEPVITAQAAREAPVSFDGYLVPADTNQESPDGGH